MTEEVENTEVNEEVNTEVEANNEEEQTEKTYTESELKKIIQDRVSREKKATEKAIAEAEKLAKMNADEKEKYEREQLEQQLEEYKRKDQFYSLSREASNMLSEHNISADDDLLGMIVKDSAEDTQTSVNAFVSLLNQKVEEGVRQALSGKSPKVHARTEKVISAEEFKNMTYPEKVQLKTDNPEMYNKIIKE